jgi:hypothetical protein
LEEQLQVADKRLLVPENLNINASFFREVLPERNRSSTLMNIQRFKL